MNHLLPMNFRLMGILFFIAGLFSALLRFYEGFKPELLNIRVFAFCSVYLESKYMQVIRNNMAEELTGFLLLTGLLMIAFSREKYENEAVDRIRLRSFQWAAWVNYLFLMAAVLFTYGFGFVYLVILNMGFPLVVYILLFRIRYARYVKEINRADAQQQTI
ncbi:MAG: hypothetical protein LWW85_03315 [Marinilabiliales bacterium]|nr:hypothetical protein [Marinilabiliales bacterium]